MYSTLFKSPKHPGGDVLGFVYVHFHATPRLRRHSRTETDEQGLDILVFVHGGCQDRRLAHLARGDEVHTKQCTHLIYYLVECGIVNVPIFYARHYFASLALSCAFSALRNIFAIHSASCLVPSLFNLKL